MTTGSLLKSKILLLFFILLSLHGIAQTYLNKIVSVQVVSQPVSAVLASISKQGGFYFSYNSRLMPADSLVSVNMVRKTVRQFLDILFPGRFQYIESGNYIIIQSSYNYASSFTISGYITDSQTGEKIQDVSIYEPNQLIAVFSDEQGFFKLPLKDKQTPVFIHISKISYLDTVLSVTPGYDQELAVAIHSAPFELDPVTVSNKVEKTWIAKTFLSSRQKIQSLNLSKFFADKPFQFSLTPGLGTHGRMGAQVINKFSLNILGGYTAGVDGVEIGGIFNIVKQDVNTFQVGGLFNVVGGRVRGVQIAGLQNNVLDSVQGVQVAGLLNMVKDTLSGFQVSGLYNRVTGQANGFQIAGLMNNVGQEMEGLEIAGLMNKAQQKVKGVQISALVNYTRNLKGLQIGLINIQDGTDGYGIGLINIYRSYHVLSVFTDELGGIDMEFKSGNRKLFSIVHAGYNPTDNHKLLSLGMGLGSEMRLNRKFFISPELIGQFIYTGSWENLNELLKLNLNAGFKINKWLAIFAGPSFAIYHARQTTAVPGYAFPIPSSNYKQYHFNQQTRGWLGWSAGFNLF